MATPEIAAAGSTTGRKLDRRMLLAGLLGSLALASWWMLWWWSATPYGRYLDHGGWGDAGVLAELCRAIPQGQILVPALAHALAWVLMIAAMMLPTTFPLLEIFSRVIRARRNAGALLMLVVLGFLAAWLAFGVVAHIADTLLRSAAAGSGWFLEYGWSVGAAVLAGAGAFQFSALKYRCLDQCHTPFAFVASRWHGRQPAREAFRLGLAHGIFCVGCCWALMAVMFVVGMGNLGWMLALAAVMAAEKNLPWGRRLRTPLGLGLLGWAGAVVVVNL